jgi:hypothetical protein
VSEPAIVIAHWPGKDVPACLEHAQKLKTLAAHLGFGLSMTPALNGENCTNCENEARKAEAAK